MKAFIKTISIIAIISLLLTMLCACGKTVSVNIVDNGVTTAAEAKTGDKVEDILADAGITLGEKDEAEPALDEKITEETAEIKVKRYAKVSVVKDGKAYDVELVGGTVADAVSSAGITLDKNEGTDIPENTFLTNGLEIKIIKQKVVSLTVDGKTKDISTSAATVKEFLDEQKITLGENDEISEKADTKIVDGLKLSVKRVEFKEETVTEEIEFSVKEESDSSLAKGESKVKQEGSNGKKEVTYKVKLVDGTEDSREVVSEKILKEATDKIVVYGAKNTGSSDSADSDNGAGGKTEVKRIRIEDCDGSGHGYYEVHYSDGSVEYIDF